MSRFLRRILLAGVVLGVLVPANYASAKDAPKAPAQAQAVEENPVVARVNGKEIRKANLQIAINNILPLMSYHGSVSDERLKLIQKTALNQLIDDILIYSKALEKKDPGVTDKDIDAEVEKLKARLPKGDTLEKVLERSNMTKADLREELKRTIVIKKVRDSKKDELTKKASSIVTEAYMKDYYQKNPDKFKEPEQYHIREILFRADPAGGQKVWDEAKKKALDASGRAKKGEDFAKLAGELSEDEYAKKGGDVGWAHSGSVMPEIEEVAAGMKVGDVSGPVMSIYGYHVVKLEGKKPSSLKKFEDLNKGNLKKDLEKKEYKRLWDEWLGGLRKDAKIEYLTEIK